MSVGLDSEGLLVIYADWIAFLREKRSIWAGQLAKLQGKDTSKENPPTSPPTPDPETLAPGEPEVPEWLLSAKPASGGDQLLAPASAPQGEGLDEMDEWM